MLERGVVVKYETIRSGATSSVLDSPSGPNRRRASQAVNGIWTRGSYATRRAVDEHDAELDVLVQKRRDKAAAKRCFGRMLRSNPVPRKIVTDQLRCYPAARADIPEPARVKHFIKAAARVNNRTENSHQPNLPIGPCSPKA